MMKNRKRRFESGPFSRVRTARGIIIGIQIAVVLMISGYLIYRGGYSLTPMYMPLDRVIKLLMIMTVVVSIEMMVFRTLEIRYAPKDGQKFILSNSSWNGAKRALVVGVLLALFFAASPAQNLLLNIMSPSDSRNLAPGESYPIDFSSQDSVGITRATELRVAVQSGLLRVRVVDRDGVLNPGGIVLRAGEQHSFALSTSSYVSYRVTFENLADASTSFAYRVDVGFPPGFSSFVAILALVVAVANLAWMFYLGRVKKGIPQKPSPRGRKQPSPRRSSPSPHRMPRRPVVRPRYSLGIFRRPVYPPWGSAPIKTPVRDSKATTAITQELPPPPPQVDPYGIDTPPPPLEKPQEDTGRAFIEEISLDIPALMDTAEKRVSTGEYQEALEDFETILHIDKRNQGALIGKAGLLQHLQRHDESLDLLNRVLQLDPWHYGALLAKGRLLEDRGSYDDAMQCYEAVLQGGPNYLEALVRKGDLLMRRQEHELARDAYQAALRLKPGDPELEAKMRSLEELLEDSLDIARREAEAGNLGRAEEFYRRALKGDRAEEARQELIDHYFLVEREEESVPLLDQAIEENSDNFQLILKRAQALSKSGKLADALEDCKRVCEMAPELTSVWAIRGALEADLGLESRAVESLERSCSMNPDDAESAMRLKELRQRERNRAELEQVLESIDGVHEGAVKSILGTFGGIEEMKRTKVKALASLEGVSEDMAKAILKRVRKGR
ncbi:MAG: tetratricopeptide repeat protein [Thermoplasmata archaeon]